jgi:hypothetical protein
MSNLSSVNTLICGKLARESIIDMQHGISIDRCGGNLLYTAYSFNLWRKGAGLTAKVGTSFPDKWLSEIAVADFNTSGIKRVEQDIDQRAFYAFIGEDDYRMDNPQRYFGELGLPFPKTLLGYTLSPFQLDNRKTATEISLRREDIPEDFLDCQFSYFCPMDFYTHSLLPPLLRSNASGVIIINPGEGYMHSSFWYDIPALLRGCTAVVTTKKRLEKLFLGRSKDIWEMLQIIASFGIELVVVCAGADGQYLYDRDNRKKYHFPAYPAKVLDTIGSSDAFGGGFLAGYSLHFDPILAVCMGNISASIKVEGSTPNYLLKAFPDLAKARLAILREKVEVC